MSSSAAATGLDLLAFPTLYFCETGYSLHTLRQATIALLSAGDFVGEGALAAVPGLRLSSATAITACTALKIAREEMMRVMHEEHEFSDLFMKFLLNRSMRIQADLVDQLFDSSEKEYSSHTDNYSVGEVGDG